MLFLDDADHLHFALLLPLFRGFVPPGHVYATARSPGSENVQNDLLSPKLSQGKRAAVFQGRQNDVGENLPDCKTGRWQWRGCSTGVTRLNIFTVTQK
jgi:hypothetical protein